MLRSLTVLLLLAAGCFSELPRGPDSDAGVRDQHDGSGRSTDAGTDSDAAAELPLVRWVENGPEGDFEEAPAIFSLLCVNEHGDTARCHFACSYDDAPEEPCDGSYEVVWAEPTRFAEPLEHRFCVRAAPEAGDARETTTCRTFRAIPYRAAYRLDATPPSSRSTAFELPLVCTRELPDGGSERRTDCDFRCSLDGRPFWFCRDSVRHERLRPGPHVLRVETSGPITSFELRFQRLTVLPFTVDEDAEPPVPPSQGPHFAPRLELEELASRGYGPLMDAYAKYAPACASQPLSREQAIESMRDFLSDALGSPNATPSAAAVVERCTESLASDDAECRTIPGTVPGDMNDGALVVRLPFACGSLFSGDLLAGERCNTHGDCLERRCEWAWEDESHGFCASEAIESHEGIRCASRGCDEGLFCNQQSACERVHAPGQACNVNLQGIDCPSGHVCSGGFAEHCVATP